MPGMKQQGICSSATIAAKELIRYAACVFEPTDVVEVRRLPSGRSTWHKAGSLAGAARSLSDGNGHGEHVYAGANPRRLTGGTRSRDVDCARCLFADFDGIGPAAARNRWQNAGLPAPTLTISSGHGIHAYWRLSTPISDLSRWRMLQKRLIVVLGSDKAIHDPARIMRLPGFMNHKPPAAPCRIIDADPVRIYELSHLNASLSRGNVKSGNSSKSRRAAYSAVRTGMTSRDDVAARRGAAFAAGRWPAASKGQRNCTAFRLGAFLVKNVALTEEQAWPILRKWNRKNKPALPEPELRRALRNASIYGR